VAPSRVLIVDDSPRIRAVLRDLVEMDGRFRVIGEAADGEQAVRKAEQIRPDVMVLDVEMPILGGLDALPEITGAAAYVEKGANVSDLLAALAAEGTWRDRVPAPATGSAVVSRRCNDRPIPRGSWPLP